VGTDAPSRLAGITAAGRRPGRCRTSRYQGEGADEDGDADDQQLQQDLRNNPTMPSTIAAITKQ